MSAFAKEHKLLQLQSRGSKINPLIFSGAVRMWAELVLVCSVITVGYSYKHGAPVDNPEVPTLCRDMAPKHMVEAQPNPGPFRVDVSRNCYCDKELIGRLAIPFVSLFGCISLSFLLACPSRKKL